MTDSRDVLAIRLSHALLSAYLADSPDCVTALATLKDEIQRRANPPDENGNITIGLRPVSVRGQTVSMR